LTVPYNSWDTANHSGITGGYYCGQQKITGGYTVPDKKGTDMTLLKDRKSAGGKVLV
jgi:hypothetical protein